MRPILLLLILLFWATSTHAQQIPLHGSVVDAQSGKPITAATIGIVAKNFFYPANDEGKFNIPNHPAIATDTISISSVGYHTHKILARDITAGITIKLTPYVTALNEVKIAYKKPVIVKAGSKVKSYFSITSILPASEVAMFMSGSAHVQGIIQTAEFYLREGNIFAKDKGDVTAPFRVKIYGVGADGKPGKELTTDIIIVSAKKKNEWFAVDISRYRIENPDSGFFVSFVLLDYTYYRANSAYHQLGAATNSMNILTPRLTATEREFKDVLSYRGTNNGTYWHPERGNYLIRATIAADAP
ncbi:MAG: carboxypeptidase-like regulatory domain-containing protein [Bacteroidota bacterium]